jgi:hypothetical protein
MSIATATATATIPTVTTMSACDKLTMDTMINSAAYSKYISRKDNETKTKLDETKTERRFYKKRIVELTKQLIKNIDHVKDSSVVNTCNAYFNACIMHFKFIDLSDTIQTEHCTGVDPEPSTTNVTTGELLHNGVQHIDSEFFSVDAIKNQNVKKINIMHNEKNILEKLFISPDSEKESPVKSGPGSGSGSGYNTTSVPRVIEIDFKDQQFKTKGIKPKSKPTSTATSTATTTTATVTATATNDLPL